MKLNLKNLEAPGHRVSTPTYARSDLHPGIVHLGVGGFHRAHEAMYLDALFNLNEALDWAIVGVGLLPTDRPMREVMHDQDCLYTLVEKPAGAVHLPRVIGSMVGYLFAPDDPQAVLNLLVDPRIRIVSLTITEGGYSLNQATGDFEPQDRSVLLDLSGGHPPRSAFGFIVEALRRRRDAGVRPFTVVSCDNIPHNGQVSRCMLTAFARRLDPALADWIESEVSFPNSMVDRITPKTADEDRTSLLTGFGVEDSWPVVCEPFVQWVLEDCFPAGRPPLERVGVQLVDDVQPYESMKLRLLNASHQALGYLGSLCGYRYVHEACGDPMFARILTRYMDLEATPTLDPVPGMDLSAYKGQLLARFQNPEISDTLPRLCAEASDRIPKFLLPVVNDLLADGRDVRESALVVASWARYAEGFDEEGERIDVVDRRRDQLMSRAARHDADPLAFLRDTELFGDLQYVPRFTTPYLEALNSLRRIGARRTLELWENRASNEQGTVHLQAHEGSFREQGRVALTTRSLESDVHGD